MVRSNCSILGKLLIILLTVLFTLGALAGTVFLVYKNAKVRSIANLFSDDLISESYDGTIEDLVQFIAPVVIKPGAKEMDALAGGVLRVLRGEERAHKFSEDSSRPA